MGSILGKGVAIVLALGIAAVSVACNVKFGLHLGQGLAGQIYAALFGLVDLLKALLPLMIVGTIVASQYLRAVFGSAMFVAFTLLSLTSAAGLYSLTKAEAVADVEAGRASYGLAKEELDRARTRLASLGAVRSVGAVRGDIEAAKQHRRWRSTKACTNATVTASRKFCDEFKRLEGELATAQEAAALRSHATELAAKIEGMNLNEVMRAADPQAEALAHLSGFTPDDIRSALAVLVALVVELGSGLGLWISTGGTRSRPSRAIASEVIAGHSTDVVTVVPVTTTVPAVPLRPQTIAQQHHRTSIDPVEAFADACIVRRQRSEVVARDLYDAFAEWAAANGLDEITPVAFGRAMTKLGYRKEKRGGVVRYLGMTLEKTSEDKRLGHMADGLLERAAAVH